MANVVITTYGCVSALESPKLTALVTFDSPQYLLNCFDLHKYADAVGRVGRSGQNSIIINLVSKKELAFVAEFQAKFAMQSELLNVYF